MRDKNIRIIIGFTLAFAVVTVLMQSGLLKSLDEGLQRSIYNLFKNQTATDILLFITNYTLGTVIGVGAVGLLLLIHRHFYGIISLGISFVGMYLAVDILKHFITRSRPFISDSTISFLGTKLPDGYSFPSGHTTIAFFLAYVIAYKFKHSKPIVIGAYLFAAIIGFSRIYLGAHYPMDVLGGLFLGLIFGHIAVLIDIALIKNDHKIRTFLIKK